MKMGKWMALLPLVAGIAACDDFGRQPEGPGSGELRWILDGEMLTKASASEIPDTNDFLLTITDAKGGVLYDGAYGDSPTQLTVPAGSYTVKVVSEHFTSPGFSKPQYGDEQVVVVPNGQSVTVKLCCTLLNAGIRLKIDSNFLTSFPDGVLYVKQGAVRIMYAYRETRIAYVFPGNGVSVILYNNGKDETLLTRSLEAREILTLSITAPGAAGSPAIQVALDTCKTWLNESFVIGGDNSGSGEGACSVAQAADHIGEKGVWVYGYIVGGDLTSSGKTVKTSGISKNTHLAMADRSSVTDKASCLAVELPAGDVRDALNLVSHPELIGTRVYVKGEIVEKYFGTLGMKGTSDFVLK
ncbi:MAG: DUF4493 domain-containing protein [Bacteroidales bacterium]|nr:DUF4493 domain-containing protein [Bacteroidales bacterium]